MSDPLQTRQNNEPTIFDLLPPVQIKTQHMGFIAAQVTKNQRYAQIVELLRERGPMAGWEIAKALGVGQNQVSGRLTELVNKKHIELTGERRLNPSTNASGNVLRLVREV